MQRLALGGRATPSSTKSVLNQCKRPRAETWHGVSFARVCLQPYRLVLKRAFPVSLQLLLKTFSAAVDIYRDALDIDIGDSSVGIVTGYGLND
jgi:hypothetical protein